LTGWPAGHLEGVAGRLVSGGNWRRAEGLAGADGRPGAHRPGPGGPLTDRPAGHLDGTAGRAFRPGRQKKALSGGFYKVADGHVRRPVFGGCGDNARSIKSCIRVTPVAAITETATRLKKSTTSPCYTATTISDCSPYIPFDISNCIPLDGPQGSGLMKGGGNPHGRAIKLAEGL
jgi:hypothetical protein